MRPLARFWASVRYRVREVQWAKLLMALPRKPALYSRTERNIWYLYVEVFWVAIFSAAVTFNATYALRLGASNVMVGWLSSIPALLAMVVLVPFARFLEGKSDRRPWMMWSLFIGRLAFLGTVLIPWLFRRHPAEAVVWLLILRTMPITLFSAGFSPMLADIIPERDRAQVFANRNIILSATVAVSTFVAGLWLDRAGEISWAGFPANYQVVYFIGSVGAMMSVFYLWKIKVPPSKVIKRRARIQMGKLTWKQVRGALQGMVGENRDFVYITLNTLLFNLGAWLVMPLYTIFFIRQLNASDGWIGLNSTLANLGVIGGYALWQRVMRKFGDQRTLLLSLPLAASYAFLVSFFPNLNAILVWGVLINLINPGVNLSHTNILYKICPEDRRASYMAIYSSTMNAGAFVGPMVGVALADVMDIRVLLIIGGVLRLLGACMFYVLRIENRE